MKIVFRSVIVVLILFIAGAVYLGIVYPYTSPFYHIKYSDDDYRIQKAVFQNEDCSANPDSTVDCIVNRFEKLYPYWLGTRWNFNGTSELPGKGTIACGYFVTTMVRDMQFDVDRVHAAQVASEVMIQGLVDETHIYRYNANENNQMFAQIQQQGTALYIVGLDNHTGFILKDKEGTFFIHSTGKFPYCVIKEKAESSSTLTKSSYKILGDLSNSTMLKESSM